MEHGSLEGYVTVPSGGQDLHTANTWYRGRQPHYKQLSTTSRSSTNRNILFNPHILSKASMETHTHTHTHSHTFNTQTTCQYFLRTNLKCTGPNSSHTQKITNLKAHGCNTWWPCRSVIYDVGHRRMTVHKLGIINHAKSYFMVQNVLKSLSWVKYLRLNIFHCSWTTPS